MLNRIAIVMSMFVVLLASQPSVAANISHAGQSITGVETLIVTVKSSKPKGRVKRASYCGQLGCSWCCLTPSGYANCRSIARCGSVLK